MILAFVRPSVYIFLKSRRVACMIDVSRFLVNSFYRTIWILFGRVVDLAQEGHKMNVVCFILILCLRPG